MVIDSEIDALWVGQESQTILRKMNGDSMEIGLAGGRYKIVFQGDKRHWVSEHASCRIDPNTPMWDAVDSILGLMG